MRWCFPLIVLLVVGGCPPAMTPADPNTPQPGNDVAPDSLVPAEVSLDESLPPQIAAPTPTAEPPAATVGQDVLLNEVRFAPRPDEDPFVELKLGPQGLLRAAKFVNDAGRDLPLPDLDAAPGALVLVLFDGEESVDGTEIHVADRDFLNASSDHLRLRGAGDALLDEVAWGPGRAAAVPLDPGGGNGPNEPLPGLALGRLPADTRPSAMDAWTSQGPAEATPGGANRNPAPAVLVPLNGTIRDPGEVTLSCYPVEAAAGYQFQVALDIDFAQITFDQTVVEPVARPTLAVGTFFWRVRANPADGSAADFSLTQVLLIEEPTEAGNIGDDVNLDDISKGRAQVAGKLTKRHLAVPSISQRKDTALLHLESNRTAMNHAWDGPHATLDTTDGADNFNCTLASTQMVNHFYGGKISQDRLGYHEHAGDAPGPETDLNFHEGNWPSGPLRFALGTGVGYRTRGNYATLRLLFAEIKQAIDGGRPLVIVSYTTSGRGTHTEVITGYEIDTRVAPATFRVLLNNPWNPGKATACAERRTLYNIGKHLARLYIIAPGAMIKARNDEESIKTDTDKDGIMDFDEMMRFQTAWQNQASDWDTDRDCISDKNEIKMSVLDPRHGLGTFTSGRMGDGRARSGNPPERTLDTDGGGLPDFMEDHNRDGEIDFSMGESDPYLKADDPRSIKGTVMRLRNQIEDGTELYLDVQVTCDLNTKTDGTVTGMVSLVSNASSKIHVDAAPPTCPTPRTISTTMDEVRGMTAVTGQWFCTREGNPALSLTVDPPGFRVQGRQGDRIDPCLGMSRVTETGDHTPFIGVQIGGTEGSFSGTPGMVRWMHRSPIREGRGLFFDWDITMGKQ